MSTPPSGTISFLFTDIEGSTKLLHLLGREQYGHTLGEHHRLLREIWQRHHVHEVDAEGDAFFVAFAHASSAVAAAADAQRALAHAHLPSSNELLVRIGVHSGEAAEHDGKYVGLAVHRAARIAAAAHGGQVLVSQTTADLLADEQVPGVGLRNLGLHRLKDLTEPQRLYQLVVEGLPVEFPPPKTLENRPTNLPSQPTPLIGRERELGELEEVLGCDGVRLLTLTGPGGTGKTRLAIQLAAETIERFPHGAFFVNLAALTDPVLVLPTVVQTLGVKGQTGAQPEQTLAAELCGKRMLLVLDNFEQVLDAATDVAALLRDTERLKVVVTSRSRLQLSGEHEYSVAALAEDEAVALFAARAQAVKSTFSLNGNRRLVAEICARLDNLPLAIELAAVRVKLLPEQALLERLDQRLKLLTGGARDLEERQRTLRAAIDWSYSLLDEEERRLFRGLAVFAGGRTLDAVGAVCDPGGDFGIHVLDGLGSLVDKSLLRQEEAVEGEPRFVMLETIHEYAREQLERDEQREALQRRHARYFLELAEEVDARLQAADRATYWMNRFEAERDNLRLARTFFRQVGEADQALRLAVASWEPWWILGYQDEGREQLLAVLPEELPPTRIGVRALLGAAYLAYLDGELDEAREWARKMRELAERADDDDLLARALHLQAILSDRDDERVALEQHALELAGDAPWATQIVESLALAAWHHEDFSKARQLLERVVETATRVGDTVSLPTALILLALLAAEEKDYASALQRLSEGVRVARQLGDKTPLVWERCWVVVGRIVAAQNSPADGLALLGAAGRVREEKGRPLRGFTAELHERAVTQITAAADEEDARKAWARGYTQGTQEYLESALEELIGGAD